MGTKGDTVNMMNVLKINTKFNPRFTTQICTLSLLIYNKIFIFIVLKEPKFYTFKENIGQKCLNLPTLTDL